MHSHARSASAAVWTPFRPVGDEDGAETPSSLGPTVVRAADGRLEVVARGTARSTSSTSSRPTACAAGGRGARRRRADAWACRARCCRRRASAAFARSASSGEIMYNGQLRNASSVYWSGWQSSAALAAGPGPSSTRSRSSTFAVDASGVLQENVEATAPPSGDCSWAGWTSLDGGVATGARVSVVLNGANLLEVYAPRAADGALAVKRQQVRRRRRVRQEPPPHPPFAPSPLTPPLPPTARRRTPRSPSAGRRGGPCRPAAALAGRHRARRRAFRRPGAVARTAAGGVAASAQFAHPLVDAATAGGAARQWAPCASSAPAPSSLPPPTRGGRPAASAAPTSTSSSSAPTAARATPSAPRTPARPPPPSAPPTRRSRRRRARGSRAPLPNEGSAAAVPARGGAQECVATT